MLISKRHIISVNCAASSHVLTISTVDGEATLVRFRSAEDTEDAYEKMRQFMSDSSTTVIETGKLDKTSKE